MIHGSSQRWCRAKKPAPRSLGWVQNFPQVSKVGLFLKVKFEKELVHLDEEARSTTPYREASSQCGRWQCGEENISCQLQPAEEEKINKSKLPLNDKNRNKTKKHGTCRALLIFLIEDIPNAENYDHRCTIRADCIRVLKRSSEKLIYAVFLASQVTSSLFYFSPVPTHKSILQVTHRMSE